MLIKDNTSKPIRQRRSARSIENKDIVGNEVKQDIDSEYVTLSEALDVEKRKRKIITIEVKNSLTFHLQIPIQVRYIYTLNDLDNTSC